MAGPSFPARVSPDLDDARRHHLSWVQDLGLVRSARKAAQYERWGIAELAASIYPGATGPDLDVAADALGWFTLLDDQFDGDRRSRVGEVTGLRDELTACLAGRTGDVSSAPLARAWAELCPRMLAGMSARWAGRAADCWQDHFDACAAEGEPLADGPDLAGRYLAVRRVSVGGYLGTVLLERVLGCELPQGLWEEPEVSLIRQGVADVAVFLNDVCSLDREKARGDQVNLATLLQDRLGWSEKQAVADIRRRARASALLVSEQQRTLSGRCSELGLTVSELATARRYADGAGAIVAGLYRWYATTGRYTGPEISDGAAFGFEDLLTSFPGQS